MVQNEVKLEGATNGLVPLESLTLGQLFFWSPTYGSPEKVGIRTVSPSLNGTRKEMGTMLYEGTYLTDVLVRPVPKGTKVTLVAG